MSGALRLSVAVVIASLGPLATDAAAQALPPIPIPEGTAEDEGRNFIGSPAQKRPVAAPQPPRHPFMAANGRSNLHDDAYMTDSYVQSGPLGRRMQVRSTLHFSECASITFDRAGRLITVCVGLERPRLVMFHPRTLEVLAELVLPPLPPRDPLAGNPFTAFGGGGYFYLDHRDRAVVPTTTRQIWRVAQVSGPSGPDFRLERIYATDLAVPPGDQITSALPDWSGRIWFASLQGRVGAVAPGSGEVKTLPLAPATVGPITNSFAVDETNGVYIVSDRALYRMEAGPGGVPRITWSAGYKNSGIRKPGQVSPGSGTTPTLMGKRYVTITDNAEHMHVVVYRREEHFTGPRKVCEQAVFRRGAGATDNSLIVGGPGARSIVVENNYGYTGPAATFRGGATTPGIERVDFDADGSGCRRVWRSNERSPSVVPKLSLGNGLVYIYTKDPEPDAWYLTALDFRTGRTVYQKRSGGGLGYNNHYAPLTIGPDGTAYVGVLGGLVLLRDQRSPVAGRPPTPDGGGGGGGGGDGAAGSPNSNANVNNNSQTASR